MTSAVALFKIISIKMAGWRCVICFVFMSFTLKLLLSHINKAHGRKPNFRAICGIDDCTEEYRVFNSFYYHLKRRHASYLANGHPPASSMACHSACPANERFDIPIFTGCTTRTDTSNAVTSGEEVERNLSCNNGAETTSQADESYNQTSAVPSPEVQFYELPTHTALIRRAAAFTVDIRERCCLSQANVNKIVAEVQQFQFTLLENMRERLRTVFERHEPSDNIEHLRSEALAAFDNFPDSFATLTTTYMQEQTIKELFAPVVPEEVVISQRLCRVKRGGSRVLEVKNKCFYYVPLIKSLEQFLSNPRIFNMIYNPVNFSKHGFLQDIVNGSLYKTHPLFSVKRTALQLILYSDEIEICNPLGSHASINKLLMFYYSLGNIEPKFRSKLPAIRLLAIAKAKDISEAGVDVILGRIEKDLMELYSGTQIHTENGEADLHGAVISVCGDTLAQHDLAGFKSGVGLSFSKCRHCECDFNSMQSNFDESHFTSRTIENHIRQCQEMERASTDFLKNALMTTYGLTRRSKLVDFPGYDLIQQTPQDIMHVILEGVAPYEIKCVLRHLILSGAVELDCINAGIQGFSYSPTDLRDKPSPITVTTLSSNDNKLKQSSGQMLTFLKIFPFIVHSISSNVYVQFIIGLLEITHIIFSPVIAIETLQKLKRLIEQHLQQFTQLFSHNNIIPKQHYMIHFPSQMELLGPLTRHMCMRFESKHRFFKKWSSKLNFKNICKSLVHHNQMVECTQNDSNNIFAHEKAIGPVGEVTNLKYVDSKLKDFLNVDKFQHVVSAKWVTLSGNTYTCGKTIIITDAVNELPVFGLISGIFVVDSVLFCCEVQVYDTLEFNRDLMSYEVAVPNAAMATEFIDLERLHDYTAYHSVMFNTKTYVPQKYDLTGVLLFKTA